MSIEHEQSPVLTRETGPETWRPSPEAHTEAQALLSNPDALEGMGVREDQYEDVARSLYMVIDPEGVQPSLQDEFKIHIDNFDILHRPTKIPEEYTELSAYADVFSLLSKKETQSLLIDCRKLKDNEEGFMLSMQDTTRIADRQRQIIHDVRETAKQHHQDRNDPEKNSTINHTYWATSTEEQVASTLDTSSDNLGDFSATRGEYLYANGVIMGEDPEALAVLADDLQDPRKQLQQKWQSVIEEKILQLSESAAQEEAIRKNAEKLALDEGLLDDAIGEVFEEKLVDAFDQEDVDKLAKDILDDRSNYPGLETLMDIEHEDPELFEVCKLYMDELTSLGLDSNFVDFDTLTVKELEQFHDSAERIISAVKEAKDDNELSALLVGRVMDYGQAVMRQKYAKSGREARNDPAVKWINDKVKAHEKGVRYHTGRLPNVDTLQDLSKYIKEVIQPKITSTHVDADLNMPNMTRLQEAEDLSEKQAVITKILAMDALVDVLPERAAQARERAQERSIKLLDFVNSNSKLIRTADMPRQIKDKLEWISVAAGRKTDRIASTQVVSINESNILQVLQYISELKVSSSIRG